MRSGSTARRTGSAMMLESLKQYRSTFGWRDDQGDAHGALLTFVEAYNRKNPKTPIQTHRDITPLIAQELQNSLASDTPLTTLANSAGVQCARFSAFFTRLGDHGKSSHQYQPLEKRNRNSPMCLTPMSSSRASWNEADWYVDERVRDGEKEVYCRRSRLFLEMFRSTRHGH